MVVEFKKKCKIRFYPAFQFFKIKSTYMNKAFNIMGCGVVPGNVYALCGCHCGPFSSSINSRSSIGMIGCLNGNGQRRILQGIRPRTVVYSSRIDRFTAARHIATISYRQKEGIAHPVMTNPLDGLVRREEESTEDMRGRSWMLMWPKSNRLFSITIFKKQVMQQLSAWQLSKLLPHGGTVSSDKKVLSDRTPSLQEELRTLRDVIKNIPSLIA